MIDRARAAVAAIIDRYTFWDRGEDFGCAFIASPNDPEWVGPGVGYAVNDTDPACWPDGARTLTIGRVTLAAWGRRSS